MTCAWEGLREGERSVWFGGTGILARLAESGRRECPPHQTRVEFLQHNNTSRFLTPRPPVDTLSIDQSAPMPVKRPATVGELCEIVKQARATGQGVYPIGGRTTLDVGLPPTKPGIALDI